MKKCIVLFPDQLSHHHDLLKTINAKQDFVLLCECFHEFTHIKHHKKKIVLLLSSMRHFQIELELKGINVFYFKLSKNKQITLPDAINQIIKQHKPSQLCFIEPNDYRQLEIINSIQSSTKIECYSEKNNNFLISTDEFKEWSNGKKQLLMENFYRMMRKKFNILMSKDKPTGDQWNFDKDNRKKASDSLKIPSVYKIAPDEITQEVITLVNDIFESHFGTTEDYHFASTHQQALSVFNHFLRVRLQCFGDYQDAMLENEPWMFHSHISFYLNCGLLRPIECIEKAEQHYQKGLAPINSVEGFIRQILGWREFVRGIYWLKMPGYETDNFLDAERKLPSFYWNAQTKLNCIKQCVVSTRDHAYAHHIQRLMILGNFALISGLDPQEVNEWFHIVYADAYQWVELPNVSGMILYADGGFLSSKPYAAGGAYINKMSNYCKNCAYKVSKKNGEDACPFNYLYWGFLIRNRHKLQSNHRLAMMYKLIDKMSDEKIKQIKKDEKNFLKRVENNEQV